MNSASSSLPAALFLFRVVGLSELHSKLCLKTKTKPIKQISTKENIMICSWGTGNCRYIIHTHNAYCQLGFVLYTHTNNALFFRHGIIYSPMRYDNPIWLKMTLNSWASCLYFSGAGITGMCYHTVLTIVRSILFLMFLLRKYQSFKDQIGTPFYGIRKNKLHYKSKLYSESFSFWPWKWSSR